MAVIDDALKTWKQRLAELEKELAPLAAEADELRDAISKVEGVRPPSTRRASSPASKAAPRASKPRAKGKRTPSGRTPRGQNREQILAAIATEAKTAGQVAEETGIGRGTVASTLHKLARDGAAVKAERGYIAANEGSAAS